VLTKVDKEKASKSIRIATKIFHLIPFSNDEVLKAVSLMEKDKKFRDLEDTIQYVLAKKENCNLILTNDKKFFSPDIKTLTTKDMTPL
jgi:predicted nucleic acid-binding protein